VARLVAFDSDVHSLISPIAKTEGTLLRDAIDTPASGRHASSLSFHDAAKICSWLERAVFNDSAETVAD
jgi:hypothetical protein